MSSKSSEDDLGLLWGTPAIARVINRTKRQTHHLLNQGAIDAAKKVGGRWCADKGGLRQQFCGPHTAERITACDAVEDA